MIERLNRRTIVVGATLVIAAIAGACANAGMPPGGPPDVEPPVILSIKPATQTIGAKDKEIEIKFDEVISETPRGSGDLGQLVFISPRVKETIVDWHRDRITIRPKGGWKPNTAYSVQISPGLQDLRNNGLDSSINVVFSTGGAIPTTDVIGVAFDWVLGKGADKSLVEAIAKDSTIYQVLSDSVGRFDLKHVPPGEYVVRAIVDRNKNRVLDPTEPFDTVRVALTQRVDVELYAFQHDTVGLRIADIQLPAADSLRILKVSFDKPLAPGQAIMRTGFVVRDADSAVTNVVLLQTAAERARADSLKAQVRADSIAAAVKTDTSAAKRAATDSLARLRRADSVAAAERVDREARRIAQLRGGRPLPPRDTTPPPKMKRVTLSTDLYLTLETPLKPGTAYRLQAGQVQNLSGIVKTPSRQFVTPRAAKKDSTKKDSTAAPVRRPPG